MVVGPGVVVEAEDQPAEDPVLLLCHLEIMPRLIVKFGAPCGGFTIINSGGDGSNQEGSGAEDVLEFKVVVFVAKDLADAAWDDACCRTSGLHPNWEAIDVGGRGCLGRTGRLGGVLGYGGEGDEISSEMWNCHDDDKKDDDSVCSMWVDCCRWFCLGDW